jgi:thymidylate synthase
MYAAVADGLEQPVRGQKVRNVHNMAVELDMQEGPVFTNFGARNFSLDYAKREWLWYVGADKYDDSIQQHATMWAKLKQPDGSFFSNYGQYIFDDRSKYLEEPVGSQFDYVVDTLKADPFSRRASIVLLRSDHLFGDNSDVVCTYAINFCIEGGALHMTVMMRSNDVIFGFTNDAFCFGELYEFVYSQLVEYLPPLARGTYTHFTNSMHVYERHFDMIKRIVAEGVDEFTHLQRPVPQPDEVRDLIKSRGTTAYGQYTNWLKA